MLLEYERLRRSTISGDTITILVHNMRSLSKHVNDIVSDSRIMSNAIIGLTETQISLSYSTCKIVETLNLFNISFKTVKINF